VTDKRRQVVEALMGVYVDPMGGTYDTGLGSHNPTGAQIGQALATMPSVQAVKSGATFARDVYEGRDRYDNVGRALEMAGLGMTGGLAGGPKGAVGAGPTRRTPALPMDDASRMARAKEMGFGETPFYRGEKGAPSEYPRGAHFSRDKGYADGFAQMHDQPGAREFRLNTQEAFRDYGPLTAGPYGRLVQAALERDPKLAQQLAAQYDKTPEWLLGFAQHNPDFVIADQGAAAAIRMLVEGSSDPLGIFTRAGFNALDSGRDVRMLTGFGIRHKDAVFDPAKADSRDIFASLAALGLLGAGAFGGEDR
jgi:hypothetical protein